VSKATRVTAQALNNHRGKKQVSFKPGPEDCYGRCGCDKIWHNNNNDIIKLH